MHTTPAIAVSSLTKRYGRDEAVRDLTFSVPAGRVTAYLGPNGDGKTTTRRMILGLVRPTAGTATVLGVPAMLLMAAYAAIFVAGGLAASRRRDIG